MNEIFLLALNRSVFIRTEWILEYWIYHNFWYDLDCVADINEEVYSKLINIYLYSLFTRARTKYQKTILFQQISVWNLRIFSFWNSKDGFFIISRLPNKCTVFHVVVVSILGHWTYNNCRFTLLSLWYLLCLLCIQLNIEHVIISFNSL